MNTELIDGYESDETTICSECSEQEDHESEEDFEEDEIDINDIDDGYPDDTVSYISKSRFQWFSEPIIRHRQGIQNTIRERNGLTNHGKVTEIKQSFDLFFNAEMKEKIIAYTNQKATSVLQDSQTPICWTVLNIKIYLGKQPNESATRNVGEKVVQDLCTPYHGSGRDITIDNFLQVFLWPKHCLKRI